MNIGKYIRIYRLQRKLTLQELAEKSDISVGFLSRIERNEREPKLKTLKNIAYNLNVSLGLLILVSSEEEDHLDFKLCSNLINLYYGEYFDEI